MADALPRTADTAGPDAAAVDGGLLLTVAAAGPSARVLVVGELDLATAPRLARLLDRLDGAGHLRIDLDLSRLTFLAAAGLGVFWDAATRLQGSGGHLRLVGVTPRIHRILRITQLDTVLDVHVPDAVIAQGPVPDPGHAGARRHALPT